MRCAYICTDAGIPVFGTKGCSIHVQEVVRALRKRGEEVILFTPRRGGEAPEDLKSVNVVDIPLNRDVPQAQRERSAMEANQMLPDLLTEHGPFDMVYQRHSLWSCATIEWAAKQNMPGVLEVNAPLVEEQANYRSLVHRDEAEEMERRAFQAASLIVAVSDEVARYVADTIGRNDTVRVLSNGVDPSRFDIARRAQPKSPTKPIVIGFVGTLKPWHGVETLLDAFRSIHAAHPGTELHIVGDGPIRESIESFVANEPCGGAITLAGAVPPASVPSCLERMDIAVAPYPALDRFYFSPLKVFEYMAAGCAVVASNIGQIPAVVQQGETGLLTKPGDARDLASACTCLIDDVELRLRMGLKARAYIEAHHTWDAVVRSMMNWAMAERPSSSTASSMGT